MSSVHPIGPEDWRAWRSVRLQALSEAPQAFGTTYREASGPNDRESYWRDCFSVNGCNFLADLDAAAVGLVRVIGPVGGDEAELISLWVAPVARGRGLGTELVEAAWAWLQTTAAGSPLWLSVRRANVPARRLYQRLGFVLTGPGPDPDEDRLVRHPAR